MRNTKSPPDSAMGRRIVGRSDLRRPTDRYARQIALPEIGKEGQEKLGRSKVVVVGVGALGTSHASFLARAGVGKLILVDRDIVELNNLQRQVLFDEGDVDSPKVTAAKEHLNCINSAIDIEAKLVDFNFSNAEEIVAPADVILDATDNMETRYLINDACVKLARPWIYGGAVGTSGLVFSVVPNGPCLRCIFPQPPGTGDLPTCDTAGVLNTLPAIIAGYQVTECFKMLTWQQPSPKLLSVSLWSREAREIAVAKDPTCVTCSERKFEFLNPTRKKLYTSICGRNAIQILPERKQKISLAQMAEKLGGAGTVDLKPNVLFFKAGEFDLTIFEDGRVLVKGTNDPVRAKTIFSKYVGD